MIKKFSKILDQISEFFAPRKGLLPLIGIGFVILNFFIRLLPPGWFSATDFFLHLGIIIGLFGLMLAWAL